MIKKNAVLFFMIFFYGYLIECPFTDISFSTKGPEVKIYYAARLLHEADTEALDSLAMKPAGYNLLGRLFKSETFHRLSINLPTLRKYFEYAQAHPDASIEHILSKVKPENALPYSEENVLQCKFWVLQARNLIKDSCTPEELHQALRRVDAWKKAEQYE